MKFSFEFNFLFVVLIVFWLPELIFNQLESLVLFYSWLINHLLGFYLLTAHLLFLLLLPLSSNLIYGLLTLDFNSGCVILFLVNGYSFIELSYFFGFHFPHCALAMAFIFGHFYFYFLTLWIRDLNREILFSPESLILPLFILVLTEFILFLSYLWGYFNILSYFGVCSEALIIIFIFTSSSIGSFILSLGSLFGGYILIYTVLLFFLGILWLLQAIYFIKMQIYEFRFMSFLSLDSILGSVFFYLTALHLFHIYAAFFIVYIIMGLLFTLCFSEHILRPTFYFHFLGFLILYFIFLGTYFKFNFILPRWIEIATGNIIIFIDLQFTLNLFIIHHILFCIFSFLYSHFVFIVWMLIDFSLNL